MASSSLQLHHPISIPHWVSTNAFAHNKTYHRIWKRNTKYPGFLLQASGQDNNSLIKDDDVVKSKTNTMLLLQHQISRLRQTIIASPPVVFLVKSSPTSIFMLGFFIATTVLIVCGASLCGKKIELQTRGIRCRSCQASKPVMYDDPFNNPQVKISKNNSTVEMCGKVYKLAPVTLTREEQDIHQKRRSRAYQWKRPTIFLKEGDPIPSDVDPDTVRWIPANHPFATTINDITEDLAQKNVYQKHGVPFRIQAEHEALQKKLEALQSDQKLNNMVIDPGTARNFERPFKSNSKLDDEQVEQKSTNGQTGSRPESQPNSHSSSTSEEKQTL
ncbi:putative protein MULTIPLE CHLOROPLAST DIVISION SITE 1 [Helianthus annuus]|nr:putative protein MULTIPLE CHLOROPLAST DIVISION SITE 1 [Helianthus annuus]